MNWFDCLITFEQIAKYQGFARAARELKLPTSAVTKQIQWLEQKLAMTLLARTTRVVTLTDEGKYLLTRIKPLLDEWQDIQRQLLDHHAEPQGDLSVCFPPNVSGQFSFVEVLHRFIQDHPKIHLSLKTTTSPVSLLNEKIDLLIGTEKYLLDPQETIGIKLQSFSYQCYASPLYLSQHGTPQKPMDLAKHNCLIFKNDYEWEFSGKLMRVAGNWQTDAGDCLITACRLGIGIMYIPSFMVQKDVQEGQLKPVLTRHTSKQDWLNIFYLKSQYKPKKISLLIDFFRQYFQGQ